MKKNIIAITITLLVVIAGALTLVQCDHSNMARVTIHIQNDLYAQKSESFIDKIFNIFSTPAYAGSSVAWDTAHTSVVITITGSDITDISATIPAYSTSYSMYVPAGNQRVVTIIGYDGTERNNGGHTVVDLQPGDNKSVTINVLPIPTNLDSPYGTGSLAWDWTSAVTGFSHYVIYSSSNPNGPFSKVTEFATNEWSSAISGKYYRVSAVFSSYGEGEPSDVYLEP